MRGRPTLGLKPTPPRGGGCARRRGARAMRGGVSAGVGDRSITYRSLVVRAPPFRRAIPAARYPEERCPVRTRRPSTPRRTVSHPAAGVPGLTGWAGGRARPPLCSPVVAAARPPRLAPHAARPVWPRAPPRLRPGGMHSSRPYLLTYLLTYSYCALHVHVHV